MLANESKLYATDGSKYVYVLDSSNYKVINKINIGIDKLNEIECVYPFLYINRWLTTQIIIYNLKLKSTTTINLANIIPEISKYHDNSSNVLNVIAYCHNEKYLLITGKKWPYYFKINLYP